LKKIPTPHMRDRGELSSHMKKGRNMKRIPSLDEEDLAIS